MDLQVLRFILNWILFPSIRVQLQRCHLGMRRAFYPQLSIPHHMCPTKALPSSSLTLHICLWYKAMRRVQCAAVAMDWLYKCCCLTLTQDISLSVSILNRAAARQQQRGSPTKTTKPTDRWDPVISCCVGVGSSNLPKLVDDTPLTENPEMPDGQDTNCIS